MQIILPADFISVVHVIFPSKISLSWFKAKLRVYASAQSDPYVGAML